MDLNGGLFSFIQMAIDSIALGKSLFDGEAFNVVKFILAILSIGYDSIFLFQRFVLYKDAAERDKRELQDSQYHPYGTLN